MKMNDTIAPTNATTMAAPIALLTQHAYACYVHVLEGETILTNEIKTLKKQNQDIQRDFERSESDVQRMIDLENVRVDELQRTKDKNAVLLSKLQKATDRAEKAEKAEVATKQEMLEMQLFFESELARIALKGKEIYDERTALIEALCLQLYHRTST